MKAKIWVDSKQNYEPYELPNGATMYETDMDKVVSCACCGKKVLYGNTYTSHKIHGEFGFAYAVCGDCYFDKNM